MPRIMMLSLFEFFFFISHKTYLEEGLLHGKIMTFP